MKFVGAVVILAANLACVVAFPCFAATAEPAEQARAAQWAAAKFALVMQPEPPHNYLMPTGNEDGLERNHHGSEPLRIGSKDYAGGLYMGRTGSVTVHLTSPAKSLEAIVGLDGRSFACGYTSEKQQFSVQVAGNTAAQSPIVEVGQPGVHLQADLKGAKEFDLRDAIGAEDEWCSEGVWADARVLLEDGTTLALGDFPVGTVQDAQDSAAPFSFTYGGKPSSGFLKDWERKSDTHPLGSNSTEYNITYRDPHSGLLVTFTGKTYRDYPVVEWTVYFENQGDTETPILENVSAIDTSFERSVDGEFNLHHFRGSPAAPDDFEPFETELRKGSTTHIATSGGRPTDQSMCYFNLQQATHGVIVALGWPGQWSADFVRDEAHGVRVRAGQELTHFKLLPHERVRSPLVALLFWNGDWIRGQNLWRAWMLADNVPRFSDGTITPHFAASSAPWYGEMVHATEANQKLFLDRYREIGIKPDFWWMDAGWYINDGHWSNTGTWILDPKRFPNGMRPVTDHAREMGIQSIVWFELERVTKDSALWKDHADWLLRDPAMEKRGQRLLNLGNPEAEKWVVQYLDKFITEQGVDVYRIDFNFEPLAFWRDNDAPDRQGITEIRYVTGFLSYLDELKKLHPHLMIDTCASGGRRDDLETLRRAVPMHRSDYGGEPVGSQNIGYGLALWVPYFGAPNAPRDNYVFRSSWSPQMNIAWDIRRPDLDYAWMRTAIEQWRSVAPSFLGDYYPLLSYDSRPSAWMAWQFDRSDLGKGVVQVFRRSQSDVTAAQIKLHGLDENASYSFTDLDTQSAQVHTGKELETTGLTISLPSRSSSIVLAYQKQ